MLRSLTSLASIFGFNLLSFEFSEETLRIERTFEAIDFVENEFGFDSKFRHFLQVNLSDEDLPAALDVLEEAIIQNIWDFFKIQSLQVDLLAESLAREDPCDNTISSKYRRSLTEYKIRVNQLHYKLMQLEPMTSTNPILSRAFAEIENFLKLTDARIQILNRKINTITNC
jgi:hypothetical protein